MFRWTWAGAAILMMSTAQSLAEPATVLYEGRSIAIENTLDDPVDLWVTPEDMTRVNGFELKPEGACYGPICVPINQNENSKLFVKRVGQGWVNLSELARRLEQGQASDVDARVWSFSPVAQIQSGRFAEAEAPDFALKNREGETVRLSDFRGKKVLILTWASW